MGNIQILVSAIRIARYFCIDIGNDLAHYECIVHRYRFSRLFVFADTSISIPGCVLALHNYLPILVINWWYVWVTFTRWLFYLWQKKPYDRKWK